MSAAETLARIEGAARRILAGRGLEALAVLLEAEADREEATTLAGDVPVKRCAVCGSTFSRGTRIAASQWLRARFCSRACAARDRRPVAHDPLRLAAKTCPECGTEFARPAGTPPSLWAARVHCSRSCASRVKNRARAVERTRDAQPRPATPPETRAAVERVLALAAPVPEPAERAAPSRPAASPPPAEPWDRERCVALYRSGLYDSEIIRKVRCTPAFLAECKRLAHSQEGATA